ncbi:hypothetical protein [Cellulomonas pakistanensis]|uniref:Uncharacterized protein n=1 Tax=Cellulomonas pakistanensis TaxID=992287 RepID=A0A919U353_9CELL|nr:hypothetical protein [Cellulomonas pakistanensis]GIG36818.1 hypothetical protein Cpa01nite_21990 [Cellulomonas pakistanensis]
MPRAFDDLDEHAIRRARIVVLHDPLPTEDGTTWLLSLVDLDGRVVAREIATARDGSLGAVVRPYLDVVGRRVDGEWLSDEDAAGRARHRARLD